MAARLVWLLAGYRPADAYLQLALNNVQLHRIADGRTPQPTPDCAPS
jgi:hypothetical protein